jgi:hypothetical protein
MGRIKLLKLSVCYFMYIHIEGRERFAAARSNIVVGIGIVRTHDEFAARYEDHPGWRLLAQSF